MPTKFQLRQHLSPSTRILFPYLLLYISTKNICTTALITPIASHPTLVKHESSYKLNIIYDSDFLFDRLKYSFLLFPFLPDSVRRFSLRFIHHRLPTGNMLFYSPRSCSHCNLNLNSFLPHDHFLLCSSSNSNKHSRLQLITKHLSCLHIPPLLQQHIIFPLRTYTTSNNPHPNASSHYLNFPPAISTIISSLNQGLGGMTSFEANCFSPVLVTNTSGSRMYPSS